MSNEHGQRMSRYLQSPIASANIGLNDANMSCYALEEPKSNTILKLKNAMSPDDSKMADSNDEITYKSAIAEINPASYRRTVGILNLLKKYSTSDSSETSPEKLWQSFNNSLLW